MEVAQQKPQNKFKKCPNFSCRENFDKLYFRCPRCNVNLDNFFIRHKYITGIISSVLTFLALAYYYG